MSHAQPDVGSLKREFHEQGFVVLRGFLHGRALAELLTKVDRFIEVVVPEMPDEHAFYEDKTDTSSLKQLQHMGDYDGWFHRLLTTGRLREIAELLLDGPAVPKNLQYFNKPPGVGRATPPHQDGYYFMLKPPQAVTMWLALDAADEENGCVRYVASSHLRPMREHARTQTLGFSQGIVDFPTAADSTDEVAITAQPGDLLVHHALTIHRAEQNASRRSRRALGLIYYGQSAQEDTAAHEAYQRRLAADLKRAGKI